MKCDSICITAEMVIVNLFKADNKKYLSLSRLCHFIAYFRKQLENKSNLSSDIKVILNVNFDTIERVIEYNDLVYELIGDTIFLKGILPTTQDDYKLLVKATQDFANKFPV